MARTTGRLAAVLMVAAAAGCGSGSSGTGAQTSQGGAGGAGQGGAGGTGGTNGGQGGAGGLDAGADRTPDGTVGALDASGDSSGDDGGLAVSRLASLDDACGGGPTGAQLLAAIHLPYAGNFNPPATRAAPYQWKGAANPTPLTVDVKYSGGAILCTQDKPFVCPAGAPCRAPLAPEVSLELALTLKTADGTLDEAFVATARYSGGTHVIWQYSLPATKIGGTYPIAAGSKDEVQLAFSGQFDGNDYNGSVGEVVPERLSIPGGGWQLHSVATGADAAADR